MTSYKLFLELESFKGCLNLPLREVMQKFGFERQDEKAKKLFEEQLTDYWDTTLLDVVQRLYELAGADEPVEHPLVVLSKVTLYPYNPLDVAFTMYAGIKSLENYPAGLIAVPVP